MSNKSYLLYAFIAITITMSCGTLAPKKKSVYTEKTVAQHLEGQNFTVEIPGDWNSIASHGYLNYSPPEGSHNFNDNRTYIFKLKSKDQFPLSVEEEAEAYLSKVYKIKLSKIRKNSKIESSNLGVIYIFGVNGNANNKSYLIFFKQDGNFYKFKYTSREHLFDKYFKESMAILASFKLK